MLLIPVDEAEAFDRMAIMEIKAQNGCQSKGLEDLREMLRKALSNEKFEMIINSPAYSALKQANEDTFQMVEKAKHDKCKASEVDRANHGRFSAKAVLQKAFWPDRILSESKTPRPYET